MKNIKRQIKQTAFLILATVAFIFSGCQQESPLSSLGPGNSENVGTVENTENIVQSNKGPIRILQVDPRIMAENAFNKGKGGKGKGGRGGKADSLFFAKKFIKANLGGEIKVGDRKNGHSKIKFKEFDLAKDDTIAFSWAPSNTLEGMLSSLEFSPHGSQFNNPVKVELSYKKADLTGVDEDSLQVYYLNEDTSIWELIGGTVDKRKKVVKVFLTHFSRYALARS